MSDTAKIDAARSVRLKGIGIALIGAFLMSLDPVFIRFSGVDELETSFLFGLFTAISMAVVIKLNDKRGVVKVLFDSGWPLLVAGLLMLGSASGLVFSIKNTSIANTFLILSATPAIAASFSWLFPARESYKANPNGDCRRHDRHCCCRVWIDWVQAIGWVTCLRCSRSFVWR